MSQSFEIRPIDLLDPTQEEAGVAWMDVHASVQRHLFGDRGSAWSLAEIQTFHRGSDKRRIDRAVWVDGLVVGAVEVMLPIHDNLKQALIWLSVLPAHRGNGIGGALLAEAERIAGEQGRTILMAETEWAHGRDDESESFAKRHGYAVGQTVLRSEQRLPADRDALAGMLLRPGAEDYELDSFVDRMPEQWLEDRAVLQQRMSTDAPSGDLDTEEEDWNAERLRQAQQRNVDSGRRVVETVARHVPTGRLVGFTTIGVSASTPDLGYQQDTLVLTEHRGHALGLRLKAANSLRLMDELPAVSSVRTWNADSNDHMLAVNRELGYAVDGYSREWQKVCS